MNTSPKGIAFIKGEEGYTPIPKDDNGHLMWGHGHDRVGFEPVPDHITPLDADSLLIHDVYTRFDPHTSALAPWANQNEFDSLSDFAYNEGLAALATMLHHGREQVPTQMAAWCYEHVDGKLHKSEGLAARRAREIALYVS